MPDVTALSTRRCAHLRQAIGCTVVLTLLAALVPAQTGLAGPLGPALAWGTNGFGQLGDGTYASRTTPVAVNGLTTVTGIAAGSTHALGVKSDGTVWAWGDNAKGQLGNGTLIGRSSPVRVTGLTGVAAVAAGGAHSLALKADGSVVAWGDNSEGQLGDGTYTRRTTPVTVTGLSVGTVSAVSAGVGHSLALRKDGTVVAWGYNLFGQLGDGTITARAAPVLVRQATGTPLTGVTAIAAGGDHSLAIGTDGAVLAWGDNSFGEVGDDTTENRANPTSVVVKPPGAIFPVELMGATAVAAGRDHSLALTSDGAIYAWGNNSGGQLGNDSFTNRSTADVVTGLGGSAVTPVTAIAAGSFHSLARLDSIAHPGTGVVPGELRAWGLNASGQLGDGTNAYRLTPVAVKNLDGTLLSGVAAIAAGYDYTLALRDPTAKSGATVGGTVGLIGRTPILPPGIGYAITTVRVGGAPVSADAAGSFTLSGIDDGTYTLTASAPGYLSTSRTISVVNGALVGTLPPLQLRAGDVFGQGAVGINEIAAIAAAFGTSPPDRIDAQGRIVDLNGDGVVDVGDVSAAAASFGLIAPQPW